MNAIVLPIRRVLWRAVLIQRLSNWLMYSVAGSMLCHTLVAAGQLHRLYITQAHRLRGGDDFDTIVRGSRFVSPRDLKLHTLYYDATALEGAGQCYAHYQLG